jgi:predicted kinase
MVPRNPPDEQPRARIWIVAGAPGAGKTTVADLLIAALVAAGRPVPALLDKDTLFGGFVVEVLTGGGRAADEREGAWYDEHVKRHEYGGMTAAAREIVERGCPVMLSAPFTQQIRDPQRWQDWMGELGGGPVTLVYVRSDPATLTQRLATRGSARDGAKGADLAAFLARMQPDVPPPVPHRCIDNRRGARTLESQVADMINSAG